MFSAIDILAIFYLLLFLWVIRKSDFFRDDALPGWWFSSIFIVKVLAGTSLAAIYTYYYSDRSTADIYKYFDDSKIMYDALWHKPADYFRMLTGTENNTGYFNSNYYNIMNNWFRKYETGMYNDSHTIIRINAFIRLFSFGSYHVHTLFACFFSLAGLTAIYRAVRNIVQTDKFLVASGILIFPSVLFWGSGVLKESFLLTGLGFFFYGFILLLNKKITFWTSGLMIAGLLLLLYLKVYVLIALLPGLAAYFLVKIRGNKKVILTHLAVMLLLLTGAASLQTVFPGNRTYHVLEQKQEDFFNLSDSVQSGSIIHIPDLEPDFLSFAKAAPIAFFNVLMRPVPGESLSPFMLLASLENFLIIAAILLIFYYYKKPSPEELNLILLCTSFVVILFLLIGWVTPVLGAIVRYKVPAIPFLGILIFSLYRKVAIK